MRRQSADDRKSWDRRTRCDSCVVRRWAGAQRTRTHCL